MYAKKKLSAQHIHFIGIGGIGMSALAIILKERGYYISGSDCNIDQKSIVYLKKMGCSIHHYSENVQLPATAKLVVYSAAIDSNNCELAQAHNHNIPVMARSELLAQLFNTQSGIAIAGSHGKTTTSSLITHIFMHADLDPTFAIGGHLHNYQTNAHAGTGQFFVAETCENDHTIKMVRPFMSILTNVDREHLDIYKDLDEIKTAFTHYLTNTKPDGTIILCYDNEHALSLLSHLTEQQKKQVITYGFSHAADIFITDFELHSNYSIATVHKKNNVIGTFTLSVPGKHNLLNALAALAAAQKAGISFETFVQACKSFQGIDRRFTFKGTYKGTEVFDDYGHHPAEIEQILKVAYRRAQHLGGRLIILFQPHRYSRTEKLWSDFIDVFSYAPFTTLIITDIYHAFEKPLDNISSIRLAHELQEKNSTKTIVYAPEDAQFNAVHKVLDDSIQPNDLVIFLGAGKINKLAELLTKKI